jgi:signal transduction histidine kinase
MPDGGVVEISTLALPANGAADRVQITIQDTGKGIRPSAKDRIFEPYYQSRPGSGNPGFSLALVYQFVALNGGTIEVEAAPGQGVAYHLRFPAAANPPHRHDLAQRMAVSA